MTRCIQRVCCLLAPSLRSICTEGPTWQDLHTSPRKVTIIPVIMKYCGNLVCGEICHYVLSQADPVLLEVSLRALSHHRATQAVGMLQAMQTFPCVSSSIETALLYAVLR